MAVNKQDAPPETLRDRIEYRNGKLYWRNMPENKHALARGGDYIGANRDKNSKNYAMLRYEGSRYAVHRVVYWLHTGGDWPEQVDHINRDKHDNRIENLRSATTSQNRMNSETTYSITAKVIGTGETRYYPRFWLEGKSFSIGGFDDENTALYAAWKIRDLLFPGWVPFPEKLEHLIK